MAKSAKIIPFRHSYPKPIVLRTVQATTKHHRKHGHHASGAKGIFSKDRMGIAMGAFALGMIQKMGIQIPKLPLLGEAGTIGIIASFVGGKLGQDIATASFAVAAYELGSTGAIVGGADDGVGGYVAGM